MSRQALIFRRRQTQHSPSAEFGGHAEPHTTHWEERFSLSVSRPLVALSRMRLSTTRSGGMDLRFTISYLTTIVKPRGPGDT